MFFQINKFNNKLVICRNKMKNKLIKQFMKYIKKYNSKPKCKILIMNKNKNNKKKIIL